MRPKPSLRSKRASVGSVAAAAIAAAGCASAATPSEAPREPVAHTTSAPASAQPVDAEPLRNDKAADGVVDPQPPAAPRITSTGYTTWIWPTPSASGRYLGYVRVGRSVALASRDPISGPGCRAGFYAVVPRGYVCLNHAASLDPSPDLLAKARSTAPEPGALPYRYVLSNGAPMYGRIPSRDDQDRRERGFGPAGKWLPLPKTLRAHQELAVEGTIEPNGSVPDWLAAGAASRHGPLVRDTAPLGSMLSYARAFAVDGRTFLLTIDEAVVPADRVRAFRPSTFHGVRLAPCRAADPTASTCFGTETSLPLGWVRTSSSPKRWFGDGDTNGDAGAWSARTPIELSGEATTRGSARYLATRERDAQGRTLYVAEYDVVVVTAKTPPPGVRPNQKWIATSITDATLVAYEGSRPVYATLISPGAGGLPQPGVDPVRASTTPKGIFYVTFKDRAATMSPEIGPHRKFWIADVPFVQYFDPPFALHAAYWHDRFGAPTSAGCINLSPTDAAWLFEWSDPQVPEGWQGVTGAGAPENGPTTAVVIGR